MRKLFTFLFIILGLQASAQHLADKDTLAIQIELTGWGDTKRCRGEDNYCVKITVENIMDTTFSFAMMTCAWPTMWQSNDPDIQTCWDYSCDRNFPVEVRLEPRHTMIFYTNVHVSNLYITRKFRMGLAWDTVHDLWPFKFPRISPDEQVKQKQASDEAHKQHKKIYWSNEISTEFYTTIPGY